MTEDPIYREIILDHSQNPQNYGVLDSPDFDEEDSNPACGDHIRLTGKVNDGVLSDIAFTAEGCAICVASASLFTEYVKSTPLADLSSMPKEKALDLLEIPLSPARIKCALLAYSTLIKAIIPFCK
jgi:nitrogen fixation protein NifU and related proteins